MIDIKIGEEVSRAYVLREDLEQGHGIIYFGEPRRSEIPAVKTDENMERNIEGVLTHESCHIAVYKITNEMWTTAKMDNIDNPWNNWPISGDLFAVCDERR